jgi:hypothetical protein
MSIRAIDYTPPIHIDFGDFLSAMLTADNEVRIDDSRYRLRDHLRKAMAEYGIRPKSEAEGGYWPRIPPEQKLVRKGHLNALQSDPTEMFRHIWNNRVTLDLNTNALTRITSVRALRAGFARRRFPDSRDSGGARPVPEGDRGRASCVQTEGAAGAYHRTKRWFLKSGSTFILDEYGELKFEVSNKLPPAKSRAAKQAWDDRLQYLWDGGYMTGFNNRSSGLASFHRERSRRRRRRRHGAKGQRTARQGGGSDEGQRSNAARIQRRVRRLSSCC